jgi:hypothetical protein
MLYRLPCVSAGATSTRFSSTHTSELIHRLCTARALSAKVSSHSTKAKVDSYIATSNGPLSPAHTAVFPASLHLLSTYLGVSLHRGQLHQHRMPQPSHAPQLRGAAYTQVDHWQCTNLKTTQNLFGLSCLLHLTQLPSAPNTAKNAQRP